MNNKKFGNTNGMEKKAMKDQDLNGSKSTKHGSSRGMNDEEQGSMGRGKSTKPETGKDFSDDSSRSSKDRNGSTKY